MKTSNLTTRLAMAALVAASVATPLRADTIVKANNTDNLNLGTSWVGGVAPGSGDLAQWDSTVTANQTLSLASDAEWNGITILNPRNGASGDTLTIGGSGILTLGSEGILTTLNQNYTLNCPMALSAPQTWQIASGVLVVGGAVNTYGHTLTLGGGNITKQFKGVISGNGDIVVNAGTLKITNTGARAPDSTLIGNNATVQFDTNGGAPSADRAKNVELNSGTLTVGGSSSVVVEGITQTLTTKGGPTITITPSATRNSLLRAGSYARTDGITRFGGTSLGLYTIASATANSANVQFTTAPALVGAGGGANTTNRSLLPGGYGDITTSGLGTGLVTYDTDYGVRLLDTSTEYTSAIADGQTQLDNVRLVGALSGITTNTLSTATTINSLSFDLVPGTVLTNGFLLNGTGTLTLNSGTIFGRVTTTVTNLNNSIVIDGPTIDLNGGEGILIAPTTGPQGGGSHGGAALDIASPITNDGGNGVSIRGNVVKFSGTSANTYTGDTRANGGFLWLAKPGVVSVPGHLIVNAGNVQNSGNQVADDKDVTVNGGNYNQKGGDWNSGSGAHETLRDFIVTGGSCGSGADGTSSGTTTLRNAQMTGGSWTLAQGHAATLSGALDLAGPGALTIKRANDSSRLTVMTVNGDVTLTQPARGSYVPLTLGGGNAANVQGGRLVVKGSLNLVVNAGNTNAVTVAATTPGTGGGWGMFFLDGTRTFDIGDGAAPVDLAIQASLTNNAAVVGGLVKAGAGTLALNGTNLFSGGTAVNVGTLAGNGSLASDVTVAANAALAPGTPGTVGTLTVNANVAFADGAVLKIDTAGATSDLLAVTGAVTGSGTVSIDANINGEDEWKILTATSISPTFAASDSAWTTSKRNGGTELWLVRTAATMVLIR